MLGGAWGPCSGVLGVLGGARGIIPGRAAAHPPAGVNLSTGGFAVDSFPMVPGLGQAVETVWRWYTRAPRMLGALSRPPGAERPHVINPPPIYTSGPTCADIYIRTPHHVFQYISPSHRPSPPGDLLGGLDLAPCPPRWPAAITPAPPPDPLHANWSTLLLRDAQHPAADWSTFLLRDARRRLVSCPRPAA